MNRILFSTIDLTEIWAYIIILYTVRCESDKNSFFLSISTFFSSPIRFRSIYRKRLSCKQSHVQRVVLFDLYRKVAIILTPTNEENKLQYIAQFQQFVIVVVGSCNACNMRKKFVSLLLCSLLIWTRILSATIWNFLRAQVMLEIGLVAKVFFSYFLEQSLPRHEQHTLKRKYLKVNKQLR